MDTQCSLTSAPVTETTPAPLMPTTLDSFLPSQASCYLSQTHGLALLEMASHHRVLDMYGSGRQRMHLISRRLDERGELVANITGALSLESVNFRHTPSNVIMTHLDDERLSPEAVGCFDRVLLDIPDLIGRRWSSKQGFERLVSLLLRAIKLCRDGGRVVYMTHGHLARNNEMVIDQVISDAHKGVALRNIVLFDAIGRPGSTLCNGQQLDPRIARTLNVDDDAGSNDRFLAVFECTHS